jgi:hypothetical protein
MGFAIQKNADFQEYVESLPEDVAGYKSKKLKFSTWNLT